jgi:hypothetical protein
MVLQAMRFTVLPTDADGFPIDTGAILWTANWLEVLARPHEYRALQRPVDVAAKAVLLTLLDVWIAYADRGDWYLCPVPSENDRPALARKLRELLDAWTPPDLPVEITEAARAVLDAEGDKPLRLEEGRTWDDASFLDTDRTVDSYLLWPEGLAEVWPKRGATDEEKAECEALRRVQGREWLAQLAERDRLNPPSLRSRRISAAEDLAELLAWPGALRRIPEIPSREDVVARWDDLKSEIEVASTEKRRNVRRFLAAEPHVDKLRALCASWTPSADVPSEIRRAARDLLAAFDFPEPPGGWDRFDRESEDGPS